MKIFFIISIFSILFLGFSSSFAQDIYTQAEMNKDAYLMFKKENDTLKHLIKKVKAGLSSDKLFIHELDNSQAKWIPYRDSMVENLYPKFQDSNYPEKLYGTMHVTTRYFYLTHLTTDRINQVKYLVERRCTIFHYLDDSVSKFCSKEHLNKL